MAIAGGAAALSGFLYQFVGTLGLLAVSETTSTFDGDGDLDVLLRVVRGSSLSPEGADADLLARKLSLAGKDDCALVEFKFSGRSNPKPLSGSEMKLVLGGLARKAKELKKKGQSVTG